MRIDGDALDAADAGGGLVSMRLRTCCCLLILSGWVAGCGDTMNGGGPGGALPYASELISFDAGEGGGYGQDKLPDVVLGPPSTTDEGGATGSVLSLGAGGSIVVGFGDRSIRDGPGDDFIVFENAFYTDFEDDGVWEELGRVSVSRDGETWHRFDCQTDPVEPEGDGPHRWPGCAGWTPTSEYDADATRMLDPEVTGGNGFDLASVGLEKVNYVRITDVQETTDLETKAGFDLDAVGVVHGTR